MIKNIYIDSELPQYKALDQIEKDEQLKPILKQLEDDSKEYLIGLDLASECSPDYTVLVWVTKNEKGEYIVMEGSKVLDKQS